MTPKGDPFTNHSDEDDSWHNRSHRQNMDKGEKTEAVAVALENLGLLHRPSFSVSQTRLVCQSSSFSSRNGNNNNNNNNKTPHNPIWDDDSSSSSSSSDEDSDDDDDYENNDDDHDHCSYGESDVGASREGDDESETALMMEFEQTHVGTNLYGLGAGGGALYGGGGGLYGLAFCPEREAKEEQNAAKIEQERLDQKQEKDEQLFMSNLHRRSIKFVEQPQVKEYEPAPLDAYQDLYYSCHQLQKFVDEANAEKGIVAVVVSADV